MKDQLDLDKMWDQANRLYELTKIHFEKQKLSQDEMMFAHLACTAMLVSYESAQTYLNNLAVCIDEREMLAREGKKQ